MCVCKTSESESKRKNVNLLPYNIYTDAVILSLPQGRGAKTGIWPPIQYYIYIYYVRVYYTIYTDAEILSRARGKFKMKNKTKVRITATSGLSVYVYINTLDWIYNSTI